MQSYCPRCQGRETVKSPFLFLPICSPVEKKPERTFKIASEKSMGLKIRTCASSSDTFLAACEKKKANDGSKIRSGATRRFGGKIFGILGLHSSILFARVIVFERQGDGTRGNTCSLVRHFLLLDTLLFIFRNSEGWLEP